MMRIAYFLGAGFSAPLGLPLMSNFIEKSRDLYDSSLDQGKLAHFDRVYARINQLTVISKFAQTDFHNVEEVLSLLDADETLSEGGFRKDYLKYVKDVIELSTPVITPVESDPKRWPVALENSMFGKDARHNRYGWFLASLTGLQIVRTAEPGFGPALGASLVERGNHYGVVTVNYDRVFENFLRYINTHCRASQSEFVLAEDPDSHLPDGDPSTERLLPYARLHGGVADPSMMLPTWRKADAGGLSGAWKLAKSLIAQCNYLRFIGYSLPTSDSYLRYLLMIALMETKNLKGIDVICLDTNGVEKRYRDLFAPFPNLRFKQGGVEDYLSKVRVSANNPTPQLRSLVADIETGHEEFMSSSK